jgi:Protein of unknown function (DUF4058)
MGSPFPGMDPYLEPCWGDVHGRLIVSAADWLQRRLPSGLRARLGERVIGEYPEDRTREIVVLSPSNKGRGKGRKLYHPDIALDLQPLLDQCYEAGRYGDDIDYREEADPPLAGEDARWADELLRAAGRR